MSFLTLLFPILANIFTNGKGGIFDLIGDYFKRQNDLALAKEDLKRQEIIAQQEALKADYEFRKAAVQSTSAVFKERMFWFLSLPILYTIFYPAGAERFWEGLLGIPEWYRTLYATIVLTIWGIPVASNWVGAIFTNVTGYLSERRQDKIVNNAVTAAAKSIDKKAFYDSLRDIKGVVTAQDVTILDKVLDKIGGK